MPRTLLCVGDDSRLISFYDQLLQKHLSFRWASNPAEALEILRTEHTHKLLLMDMRVATEDQSLFLSKCARLAPNVMKILLVEQEEQDAAIRLLNDGKIARIMPRHYPPEILIETLHTCFCEQDQRAKDRELLKGTIDGAVKLLAEVLMGADPMAFGRGQILREYASQFYRSLYGCVVPWDIELACTLLSIGYVTIPPNILYRARAGHDLTDQEERQLLAAPQAGSALLSCIPRLESVAEIVLYQNKNFDGSGFPSDGVAGSAIPFGARLFRVLADLMRWEAAGDGRCTAYAKLEDESHLYDPSILDACKCGLKFATSGKHERVSQVISLDELGVLDVLSKPLPTRAGLLVAPEGTVVSKLTLRKIRNFAKLNLIRSEVSVSVLRPISPDPVPKFRRSAEDDFAKKESTET
jgi:CheY-like chemotaxis protein